MAKQQWSKTYYLDRSLGVTRSSVEALIKTFINLGGELRRINLDLPNGERHQLDHVEELQQTSESTIFKAEKIVILGTSKSTEWYILIARVDSTSSLVSLDTTNEADLFIYKGALDHYVEKYSSEDALNEALFFSLALSSDDGEAKVIVPRGTPAPRLRTAATQLAQSSAPSQSSGLAPAIELSESGGSFRTKDSHDKPARSTVRNARWTPAIGLLIPCLGLLIYFWQGKSGSRQATASEKQTQMEGEAQFYLSKQSFDGTKEQIEEYKIRSSIPLDITLKNVGKQAASNVTLQCGTPNEHGPYLELGTIAAGEPKVLHLHPIINRQDIMHKNDGLCLDNQFHISYNDADRTHFAYFDDAGNEHREDESKK